VASGLVHGGRVRRRGRVRLVRRRELDMAKTYAGMNGAMLALSAFYQEVQLLEVFDACNVRGFQDVSFVETQSVEVFVRGTQVTGSVSGAPFSFTAPANVAIGAIGFGAATARCVVPS
jgi:hypothetical protein